MTAMRFQSVEKLKERGIWAVLGAAKSAVVISPMVASEAADDAQTAMNYITHLKELLAAIELSRSTEEIVPIIKDRIREALELFDIPEIQMRENIRLLKESQDVAYIRVSIQVKSHNGMGFRDDIDAWEVSGRYTDEIEIGTTAEEVARRLPAAIEKAKAAFDNRIAAGDLKYSKRSLDIKKEIEVRKMMLETYRASGQIPDEDIIKAVLEGETE